MSIVKYWVQYLRGTQAIAAMEYAIIVGVVVVGLAAAAATFNTNVTTFITRMSAKLTSIAT